MRRSAVAMAILEPTRAPGTVPATSSRAKAQLMCPSQACETIAGIEKMATATRLEATATFTGSRSTLVNSGIMIAPPPMPSRPARNPATAPTPASAGTSADRSPSSSSRTTSWSPSIANPLRIEPTPLQSTSTAVATISQRASTRSAAASAVATTWSRCAGEQAPAAQLVSNWSIPSASAVTAAPMSSSAAQKARSSPAS